MKKIYLFLLLPVLIACKPTEKGYQAAYDAALNKREQAKADIDVKVGDQVLQQVDGPQLKQVDGVDVYLLNSRLTPADFVMKLPENYNVAIGKYKMITNCKAQAEMLLSDGYHAFPAKDTEGAFYTIAGSFATLSEAVKFSQEYQKKKGRTYVGLPSAPVIIYSPK